MTQNESETRQQISRLIRQAAENFARAESPLMSSALPRMDEAIRLAEGLDDKIPLVICESNLASMKAVCRLRDQAIEHIERALAVVREHDLPVPVRNFAHTKFIETGILLNYAPERVLASARGLLHCAVDEEGSRGQYLVAMFNLAVVASELLDEPAQALALFSFLEEQIPRGEKRVTRQMRKALQRIYDRYGDEESAQLVSDAEANRDTYVAMLSAGYLPAHAPRLDSRHAVPDSDSSEAI